MKNSARKLKPVRKISVWNLSGQAGFSAPQLVPQNNHDKNVDANTRPQYYSVRHLKRFKTRSLELDGLHMNRRRFWRGLLCKGSQEKSPFGGSTDVIAKVLPEDADANIGTLPIGVSILTPETRDSSQ